MIGRRTVERRGSKGTGKSDDGSGVNEIDSRIAERKRIVEEWERRSEWRIDLID